MWRRDPIVFNNRRLSVLTHIGTLLYREYHTLRVFDPALGNFVAIDEERPRTALADAAAIIGELITDSRLADRHALLGSNGKALQTKEIVSIGRLAVLQIETPAAEPACLGEDYPLGSPFGYLYLGSDRVRPVLCIDKNIFRYPRHSLIDRQRRPPGHQVGSAHKGGVKALQFAVIERQHVVLDCFLREQLLH